MELPAATKPTNANLFASSEKNVQWIKVVPNDSIGTCSSELYIFSLLKLPPPASCGYTGIYKWSYDWVTWQTEAIEGTTHQKCLGRGGLLCCSEVKAPHWTPKTGPYPNILKPKGSITVGSWWCSSCRVMLWNTYPYRLEQTKEPASNFSTSPSNRNLHCHLRPTNWHTDHGIAEYQAARICPPSKVLKLRMLIYQKSHWL